MINEKNKVYYQQVELMLKLLPLITEEKNFSLKGGTAINFFIRDMPRLSVDIDLTYLPIEPRDQFLLNLENSLLNVKGLIEKKIPKVKVYERRIYPMNRLNKLFIYQEGTKVKIEPNEILRGSVFMNEKKDLVKRAEETFGLSVTQMPVLSLPDLYGGKICAALDRQHPRDLFDVQLLMQNEGFTDDIRKAFIIYLASSSRPIHEILRPSLLDMNQVFEAEFLGMTNQEIKYDELVRTRHELINLVHKSLTAKERFFLLSVKIGEPNWSLLDCPGVENLPGLQWKLKNILKMHSVKSKLMIEKLKRVLEL